MSYIYGMVSALSLVATARWRGLETGRDAHGPAAAAR